MYTIQANQSGTRTLEISEEHLQTIEKYALFQHLIDSNGIVDESVLDKLSARPLHRRDLPQQHEGNRAVQPHPALHQVGARERRKPKPQRAERTAELILNLTQRRKNAKIH